MTSASNFPPTPKDPCVIVLPPAGDDDEGETPSPTSARRARYLEEFHRIARRRLDRRTFRELADAAWKQSRFKPAKDDVDVALPDDGAWKESKF